MSKIFNARTYPRARIALRPSLILPRQVGAFALQRFGAGDIIVYADEFEDDCKIPIAEYRKLNKETKDQVTKFCCITPTHALVPSDINHIRVVHFMNHSCEPNVGFDKKDNYIAMRTISKGEELLMCYSLLYTDPYFKMKCLCRTPGCRGTVTGNDWKDPSLIKEYGSYVASTIRELL